MSQRIELPNGEIAEFPDGMPITEIESVLHRQFGGLPEQPAPDKESYYGELRDKLLGVAEAGATVATGAIAEPVAGIAGIAQSLNPFADSGAGARAVESTRSAMTYTPKTEEGAETLQAVAGAVEPVAKAITGAEDWLGDETFEATGSPALAAAAKTMPTLVAEILGLAVGKGALRVRHGVKNRKVTTAIAESAPSIDQLKDASRAIYKEIDDMGASVKPKSYTTLVNKISKEAKSSGLDVDITPKSAKALKRIKGMVGEEVTLTDLDVLRKVTQNAAGAIEKADAAIGMRIIDTIDDFLSDAGSTILNKPKGAKIGARYKAARDLWGRARKSEMIGEAFEKARNQASGFENGIRVQFRQILNNKKRRKFFNKQEIEAMTRVVRGTKKENLAKLVGRLGFSEGSATNIIGGTIGMGAGGAVGGVPGAIAVPLIGQVSRKMAQRMTANNAVFADQVIRSGKNARKIVQAYMDHTPKNAVNPAELSQLLMRKDINLANIPGSALAKKAAEMALESRTKLAAAATAGALTPGDE